MNVDSRAEKKNAAPGALEALRTDAEQIFRSTISDPTFPCVGAKAALNSGSIRFAAYEPLGSAEATRALAADLAEFVTHDLTRWTSYATMGAIFRGPLKIGESQFEDLLWLQLRKLHEIDAQGSAWDPKVNSDPADPEFSFSFAGQAFYVLGMHDNSSRHARRFPWPTLVFNPHEQFERLRSEGNWQTMQRTIRERELQLQGSINPMLNDFGTESEARQYSGRAVEEHWRAPFPTGKCPFGH